ncbi:MAG: aminotransferase class I/II-fold pyridoxal phosphate-dependent enzyme [Eubacteriales bacterium]|nr:aminotransferase class I/II-fold pyridoxal phosphate-dependent enzyme [Clostridiales bacterium]MDD7594505.1 aminotransferase class I/II-fold pyridoxal phosphate-dependent enzyme [Clostridiales bacterium]MDY4887278.1 aminotransferase class I/II-fold pyridoxal phosphate-dependent enzyme [Eubacteriales bacterium]MDY5860463.1 aminotransferase class I/II-fold pyridoxal phosphate-dependent enzyme [Eubacteriales bacterium]
MFDYGKVLSPTVTSLKKSGIRKFFDLLEDMDNVVSLTVGQPDFITPWHIREAGIESLERGKTYYTSNAGTLELRNEIASYLSRRFDLTYDPKKEITVTVGGSEAIDMAIRSLVVPGDEVIIPEPCFVCYEPLVKMAGGIPVIIDTSARDKFKLTPEKLAAAITPKTKLLVLAYPNNPTGAVMTRDDLEKIAQVLRQTNIVVLSDEIYAELTFGFRHTSIVSLPGMRERTVLASGFSKAYAMTGWRLGYVCAPAPISEQILKLHQYAIMCAPTTSQLAAVEAMKNGDSDIEYMAEQYNFRRRYIYRGLSDIGIESFEPEGAFYIYPEIGKFGLSSEEFCNRLLYDYHCAIVPGTAFGRSGEGFARISYAYSVNHIDAALERIEAFIKTLR